MGHFKETAPIQSEEQRSMDHQETILSLMRQGKEKINQQKKHNADAAWTLYQDPEDILNDPAYGHLATREEKQRAFREVQKAYDIRGFVSQDPDDPSQPAVNFPLALARRIGTAIGSATFDTHKGSIGLKPGDVFLVGMDNGPDSPKRAEALAEGLSMSGINVVMLGVSPSGELYNAVSNFDADGGAQITRSHVEINVNGVKMLMKTVTLFGDDIKTIFDWVERNEYRRMTSPDDYGAIIPELPEAFEIQRLRYLQRYEGRMEPDCELAIDLGGGTAVKYIDTLKKIFPSAKTFYRDEFDTYSSKGLADPTRLDQKTNFPDALEDSEKNPKLPILSFDLDADRIGLMLNGVVWKGDALMLPVIEEQLKRKPDTPVRVDARTSMIVDQAIKHWGGTAICQAIGHSKVKKGMDMDLVEEARRAGFEDADAYVQAKPELAETFQGEFSLHLFRFKPEINDAGVYVGTPVDDAIDFACYFIQKMQAIGRERGNPCMQIPEYLDALHAEGVIGDNYKYPENNIEIRSAYDPMLKKNLGLAAHELLKLSAAPDTTCTWIDDGVSIIGADRKLMLRYSNTSPKITMKCDALHDQWLTAAEYLLSIYFALTDYLIAHRGMPKTFRILSKSENGFLYDIFGKHGKDLNAIPPFDLAPYLSSESLKNALDKDQ